jgi:hypothetical protein
MDAVKKYEQACTQGRVQSLAQLGIEIKTKVERSTSTAVEEVCGHFWPLPIYSKRFQQDPRPSDISHIDVRGNGIKVKGAVHVVAGLLFS